MFKKTTTQTKSTLCFLKRHWISFTIISNSKTKKGFSKFPGKKQLLAFKKIVGGSPETHFFGGLIVRFIGDGRRPPETAEGVGDLVTTLRLNTILSSLQNLLKYDFQLDKCMSQM